jgi:hypothetical protein
MSLFELYGLDVAALEYRELIGLAAYENPDATRKLADRMAALLDGRDIKSRDIP